MSEHMISAVIEYTGKDAQFLSNHGEIIRELEKSKFIRDIHVLIDETGTGDLGGPAPNHRKNSRMVPSTKQALYWKLSQDDFYHAIFRFVPKAYDLTHKTFENMFQFFLKNESDYVYSDGDDLSLNGMTIELFTPDLMKKVLNDRDPFLPDGSVNAWTKGSCAPYLFSLEDQSHYYQGKYKDYFRYPRNLNLELSRVCNLTCDMCMYFSKRYPKFFSEKDAPFMSFDLYKKIIDQIASFDKKPSVELCYRGEPLLNKKACDMVAYARNKDIMTIMITNGTLLDQKTASAFLDNDLNMIMFSLDGITKETYESIRKGANFEKVNENIERFLDTNEKKTLGKTQTIVKLVYQKENMHEIDSFVRHWIERVDMVVVQNKLVPDDPRYHAIRLQDPVGSRFNSPPLERRLSCRNPWVNMMVTTEGKVLYCAGDYRESHSPGSLANIDVEDLWQGPAFREIRVLQSRGRYDKIPLCSGCDGRSCSGLTLEKRLSGDLFSTIHIIHEIHRKRKPVYRIQRPEIFTKRGDLMLTIVEYTGMTLPSPAHIRRTNKALEDAGVREAPQFIFTGNLPNSTGVPALEGHFQALNKDELTILMEKATLKGFPLLRIRLAHFPLASGWIKRFIESWRQSGTSYYYTDGDEFGLYGLTMEMLTKECLASAKSSGSFYLPDGSINGFIGQSWGVYPFHMDDMSAYYKGFYRELYHSPRGINLDVSRACNLRCRMCCFHSDAYHAFEDVKTKPFLDLEDFRTTLAHIEKSRSPMPLDLTSRGEPLLNPDIIKIVEAAHHADYEVNMVTNGTLMGEETAKALIQAGVSSLFFSVDGAEPSTYETIRKGASYADVRKNIERFLKLRPKNLKVGLKYVLQDENRHEVDQFLTQWLPGMDWLVIVRQTKPKTSGNPSPQFARNADEWEIGNPISKKYPCRYFWCGTYISTTGEVICCSTDHFETNSFGSIKKTSMNSIWNSPRMHQTRERFLKGDFNDIALCSECSKDLSSAITLKKEVKGGNIFSKTTSSYKIYQHMP